MRFAKMLVVALTALVLLAGSASAVVIADYQADFQGGAPAAGWAYQWNSGGAIGTAANDLEDGDSGVDGRGVRRRKVDRSEATN